MRKTQKCKFFTIRKVPCLYLMLTVLPITLASRNLSGWCLVQGQVFLTVHMGTMFLAMRRASASVMVFNRGPFLSYAVLCAKVWAMVGWLLFLFCWEAGVLHISTGCFCLRFWKRLSAALNCDCLLGNVAAWDLLLHVYAANVNQFQRTNDFIPFFSHFFPLSLVAMNCVLGVILQLRKLRGTKIAPLYKKSYFFFNRPLKKILMN